MPCFVGFFPFCFFWSSAYVALAAAPKDLGLAEGVQLLPLTPVLGSKSGLEFAEVQ